MAFDISGALQEGYSYSDIANHLAEKNKFDVAGARNEGYTDEQIVQHLTASRTAGIGEAIKGGTKRLVESIRTGIEAPFIGGEEAATKGLARQEAITERPAASLDEIKRIYKSDGFLPAAKEAISQIPAGIAEQAPFIGTMIGGARLGAMVGGVPGAIAGAALSPFLSAAGSNIERQAQEDIKAGRPIDISRAKAYAAALPQAALDVGAMELGLGKALGISKMGTEAAEKMAAESLKKSLTIGVGKTALAEVPTEVVQQMLERSQAGLSLTDPEAIKEYKDTAYQAVLLSPLGGAARLAERGEARQKQAALANLALDQQRAYGAAIAAEEQAKLKNDVEEIKRQKAIQDIILPPETYKLLPAPTQEPIVATSTEALGTEKQIEEYLKTVPEDQQVAERARLTGMAPQGTSPIISNATLDSLGINKKATIRKNKELQGLDLTIPEDAQKAVDVLTAFKNIKSIDEETKSKIQNYITNIPNLIETVKNERLVREAAKNERLVTEGSRDNLQVSGQPISGEVSTTAQGELGDGVTNLADVTGRLEGRTEAQPAALAPTTTEVMKSAEELAPTTEEVAPTEEVVAEQQAPLTQEAEDLISTVDEGGVPGFMTNNLRRIAKENGVEVAPADTPNTVIESLRSKQTPKYAKEKVTTTSETPETILTALKQRFGNNINKAMERGDVKLITSAQVPADIASDAVAYFDKGVAHLITDRLSKEEAPRKILHEVGAHYGLEGMVGKSLYRDILRTINRLKATDKDVRAAHEHVNNKYKELEQGSQPHLEEVLARLGESAPNHNLWRRIVAAVKDFLFKKGLWNVNRMDVKDIQDLINRSTARSLAGKIKPVKTTELKYAKEEAQEVSPEFEGTKIFAAPQENLEKSFKEHVTDLKNFKYQEGSVENLFLNGRIKAAYSGAGVASALMKKFNGAVRDALGNVRADILMSIGLQSNILGSQSAKEGYVDFDSSNVAYVAPDQNNLANINEEVATLAKRIGVENAKHVTQAYLVGLRYEFEREENNRLETQAKKEESEGKKATAAKTREGKTKITEEQQAAIPEALSYGEKYPEVKRVADMYKVFNDNDTNMLEKAGIYSKEQAERYRRTRGYVPLFRLMDEMERSNPGARQFFRGFADVGREYAFEGSERQVLDVFDNMLTRHMWAVNAAVRNIANQQVAKQLAIRNDNGKVELHEHINPEKADRMAPVFVNGKRRFVEYTDPNFAIAIHGAEPALGPILGWFGKASRLLRISVTSLPPFQAYQVFNDATRAAMLSGVDRPFQLMGRVMTSFGKLLTDKDDPISIEMRRLGISGGYGHTALEVSDKMRRDLNLKTNTLMKQALDKAEAFAAASDMAQRRALFIQTLLETGGTQNPDGSITGGNKVLAAHRAMDIINWQKHGTSGKLRILSQVVPFMNAYIQGMDVLIGAMRGEAISGKAKKEAQYLFLQTAMKITALSALYAMLVSDDEEYQKLDDRTKIRSFIIPGVGFKIPVSAEVALLTKAVPELGWQYITREGTASPMDATKLRNELGVAVLDGLLGPNLLPQIARPTLEAVTNYNFLTGSPLVGRGLENLETSRQFTENTSELAKFLGKSGIISPLKLDHLIKGYAGTTAALTLYTTDAMANVFYEDKLPTTPLYRIPSIGAFMYSPNGKDQLNDYYDLKDRTDEVTATFNRLVKFGHPGEAREYAQENKELLTVRAQVNAITNNMKTLREVRNSVINSPLSSDDKRARLNEIDLRINAMVKNIGALRVKAGL
jgi:hypothetical protein